MKDKGLKDFLLYTLLKLPEPKPKPSVAGSPWEQAGKAVASKTAGNVPWSVENDSGRKVVRAIFRIAVFVLIGFFVLVGVRSAFGGRAQPEPAAVPASLSFDRQGASGVAARFVRSALTWDPATSETRTDLVGLDFTGGKSPLGWNGQGKQSVVDTVILATNVNEDGTSAMVTVGVQILTYTATGIAESPWEAKTATWTAVEVPIKDIGSRLVATAAPAFVGTTDPDFKIATDTAKDDTALSQTTREAAEAFFTAYAEGDVTAVAAPGAAIKAPVPGLWTVEKVSGWTVRHGTGDTRIAHAVVTWIAETSTVEQTYEVTITRVSSGKSDRWQVSDISNTY